MVLYLQIKADAVFDNVLISDEPEYTKHGQNVFANREIEKVSRESEEINRRIACRKLKEQESNVNREGWNFQGFGHVELARLGAEQIVCKIAGFSLLHSVKSLQFHC